MGDKLNKTQAALRSSLGEDTISGHMGKGSGDAG